jgi:hypothetical protein
VSERGLKRLVGALAAAVVLWLVVSALSGGNGDVEATGAIAGWFDGLDEASVDAVRVSGPDGEVELLPGDGGWRVNGFDADSMQVVRLFRALSEADVGNLVAANPDNHARMGVAEDSAYALEVDVEGETRTLLVGDSGSRFGTAYARLPGEDEVYLVEGDLRGQVTRRLEDWRRKRMTAVDTSRVDRIEIERDGETYALARGDSVWTFDDGGDVDGGTVRDVLSELDGLLASGFLSEADSLAGAEQAGSVVAYDEAGEVLADITLGAGEDARWARVAGDSVLYSLARFRVDRVAPTLEQIRPDS